MSLLEDRVLVRRLWGMAGIVAVIACVLTYSFTTRSPIEKERARARVMLETIHRLQVAHRAETGTYFSASRGNTQDVLKLSDPPGRFTYTVERTYGGFVATAEADLDGDGVTEVWQTDALHPEPYRVRED